MMATRADEARPVDPPVRVTPKLFLAAGLEIGVAVAVAALVMRSGHRSEHSGHAHSHSGMAGMYPEVSASALWSAASVTIGLVTGSALVWWAIQRAWAAAVLAAAGLAALAASPAVRTMATASHVVAMAALEVLVVVVPLLLVAAARRSPPPGSERPSRSFTAGVIAATVCYSALLIVLHLPVVHNRAAQLGLIPLWLVWVIVAVGIGYWTSILATAGLVRTSVRRRALIIGQEVGAILALAAIIRPDATMAHSSPLGISAQLDQRLGGLLMLVTCAAVTLPLMKKLAPQDERPVPAEESDGH